MSEAREHNIFLYDRRRMELCGISEIESFSDEAVSAVFDGGGLTIEGNGLKIDNFSVGSGELTVSGFVTGFYYYKNDTAEGGAFSRLFKRK